MQESTPAADIPQPEKTHQNQAQLEQYLSRSCVIESLSPRVINGYELSSHSIQLGTKSCRQVSTHLHNLRSDKARKAESVQLSSAAMKDVDHIMDHTVSWLRQTTNTDTTARKPLTQKIFFHTPSSFQAIRDDDEMLGLCYEPYGEIHVPASPTRLYDFSHELAHKLGYHQILVSPAPLGFFYASQIDGFVDQRDAQAWFLFTEYIVETVNRLSLHQFQRSSGVDCLSNAEPAYVNFMLYFDVLLETLSQSSSIALETIRDSFIKAFLLGDFHVLSLFDQAFGPGSKELVSQTGDKMYCTAFGIDIPDIKARKQAFARGQTLYMKTWNNQPISKH